MRMIFRTTQFMVIPAVIPAKAGMQERVDSHCSLPLNALIRGKNDNVRFLRELSFLFILAILIVAFRNAHSQPSYENDLGFQFIVQQSQAMMQPPPNAKPQAAAAQPKSEDKVAMVHPDTPFWREKEEGWFWYKELLLEPVKPQEEEPKDKRPIEVIEFENLQKKMDEMRKIAILNPTRDNVRNYMILHKQAIRKARNFAETWQRIVWQEPFFDHFVHGRPPNTRALEVYDREKEKENRNQLARVARTHGLFFYFSGNCPYCHTFAPILKRFSEKTGMTVFPISIDGEGLYQYPNPVLDNGSAEAFGVSSVPAVVLAEPGAKTGVIVGHGVLSETELYERIYALTAQPITGEQPFYPGEQSFSPGQESVPGGGFPFSLGGQF